MLVNKVTQDQTKAGTSIKGYIENSDQFMNNFKATRDSEFSQYSEIGQDMIEKLHENRNAEIGIIKGENSANIDLIKVSRKNQGSKFKQESYQKIDDLKEDKTEDEEKLLEHFLKKRDDKAKFAEVVRVRQAKLSELNE